MRSARADDAFAPLEDAVLRALKAAGLLRPGARLVAAVSGGADSVALIVTLCRVAPARGLRVLACHVQHGLRGQSSLLDERFVRALCGELRVPLAVRDAGLSGTMDDPGAETRAREARLRLFDEVLREADADALLTAHHLDDQAETALMRLLRGAGAAGLCAMREAAPFSRGVLLRPFLSTPKALITAALDSAGQGYRTDESNLVPGTPRNALRLDVMPRLDALFPGAARRIAECAEGLRADESWLEAQADALYRPALLNEGAVLALRVGDLAAAPDALLRRAARRLYREAIAALGADPAERGLNYADTLTLAALLRGPRGGERNLPCGLAALRGWRCLHIVRQGGAPVRAQAAPAPLSVSPAQTEYRFGGVCLRLRPCPPDAPPPTDARAVRLPAGLMDGALTVGPPLVGDELRPMGAPGRKPLRRYLTDRKIDPPFRAALPVLRSGARPLWLPGLCADEILRARPRDASPAYLLEVAGEIPYLPQPLPTPQKE